MADHFHALEVAAVTPETADAISLTFTVPPPLADMFRFRAGQHLTLRALIDGEDVRRNYSLCVAPDEGLVKVAVKRITGGLFSNWVADHIRPGDRIEAMAPHGSFGWDFAATPGGDYVGFAGGSGITPILSLIKTALRSDPAARFTLFYGNRDSDSIIFLEELSALKNIYLERLTVFHFLSDEVGDVDLFNTMLNRDTCSEVVRRFVVAPPAVDAWFICGPGPMMDAAEAALLGEGVAAERILIERFTAGRPSAGEAAALAAAQEQATGRMMTVTLDGRTRKLAFSGSNILDSTRAAGLPAPFACKAGVCATCRAKVVRGTVEMGARYGLSDEEIAAGFILTCQSVPTSEDVAVDYDA